MKAYYSIVLVYVAIITFCTLYEEHPSTVYSPLGESNILQDVGFWLGVSALFLQPIFLRAKKKRERIILLHIVIHVYFLLLSHSFWANLYHRGHASKKMPYDDFTMLIVPLMIVSLIYAYSIGIRFSIFMVFYMKKKLTSRDSQHLGCA